MRTPLGTEHRLEIAERDLYDAQAKLATARAEMKRMREALADSAAHLTGAASAYRKYASRHKSQGRAVADPFFKTRADDFDKAAARSRAALGSTG